ncbi:GntR family transcriptional regulator [Micromonospora sp. WMMD1128]|uniref:GntR family transcriptional regulator n=1 Tax=Micromonospora sp. WMMD1128 TaxID=3015150 RepID=UPI00248B2DD8|nr:GntR family transcriptional regulator [Micromonospora sp. WMMD1128]WBB73205.1 GntR family transcriptional regulator [Micromonospora sp. WMMD1128]
MSLDPHSGVPLHRQLAAALRARIAAGEWPAGGLLPAQSRIGYDYGVGKAAVQAAVGILRNEGLVVTERGYGTRVAVEQELTRVAVPRGAQVRSRMPTEAERAELGIEPGAVVPVLVVSLGGRVRGVYAADRVVLTLS